MIVLCFDDTWIELIQVKTSSLQVLKKEKWRTFWSFLVYFCPVNDSLLRSGSSPRINILSSCKSSVLKAKLTHPEQYTLGLFRNLNMGKQSEAERHSLYNKLPLKPLWFSLCNQHVDDVRKSRLSCRIPAAVWHSNSKVEPGAGGEKWLHERCCCSVRVLMALPLYVTALGAEREIQVGSKEALKDAECPPLSHEGHSSRQYSLPQLSAWAGSKLHCYYITYYKVVGDFSCFWFFLSTVMTKYILASSAESSWTFYDDIEKLRNYYRE